MTSLKQRSNDNFGVQKMIKHRLNPPWGRYSVQGISYQLLKIPPINRGFFFQLNIERNPLSLCFLLISLCHSSRKFAPLSRPVGFKTKTNRDGYSGFPVPQSLILSFYVEYLVANDDVNVFTDRPLWLLWFWCADIQLKTVPMQFSQCQSKLV